MYFQVYSYSTYPEHSGERYRTNGPLIITNDFHSNSCLISENVLMQIRSHFTGHITFKHFGAIFHLNFLGF